MEKKEMINKMLIIYGFNGKDWMGFRITKINPISNHHIIEKRNLPDELKEVENIENNAILSKESHKLLHMMEYYNPNLYEDYQYLFRLINDSQQPLNKEFWRLIYELKDSLMATLKQIYKKEIKSVRAK